MRHLDRAHIALLVIALVLIAAAEFVFAGGGDDTTASATADLGGVSTTVRDSSTALGLGGGDVDINDYYRSYSYLFGLIQETRSNPLAVARDLMAEGQYEAAAFLRCQPWGIYRAYGGKSECITALSKPPILVAAPAVSAPHEDDDEDEDYHEEQMAAQAMLYEELQAEVRDLRTQVASEPQQVTRTIYVDEGAERRAKARAARDEILGQVEK